MLPPIQTTTPQSLHPGMGQPMRQPGLSTPGPALSTPGPALSTPGPALRTPGPSLGVSGPLNGSSSAFGPPLIQSVSRLKIISVQFSIIFQLLMPTLQI